MRRCRFVGYQGNPLHGGQCPRAAIRGYTTCATHHSAGISLAQERLAARQRQTRRHDSTNDDCNLRAGYACSCRVQGKVRP